MTKWNDERSWRDIAVRRAAVEGIPDVDKVQAILDHYGITLADIEAQTDAEQAGITEGTIVPLATHRRTLRRTPN